MTTEELHRIGIVAVTSSIKERRYFIPYVGEATIPENYSFAELYGLIHDMGFIDGTEHGKEEKVKEIKKILDIPTRD